jgi:hypothetical protein
MIGGARQHSCHVDVVVPAAQPAGEPLNHALETADRGGRDHVQDHHALPPKSLPIHAELAARPPVAR